VTEPQPPRPPELVQTFRFSVTLALSPGVRPPNQTAGPISDGKFAECSGLELDTDVREYLEGGRNDGVIRRVGRVKLVPIVLKRGMFLQGDPGYANTALWDWLTGMVSGTLPIPRYDGTVSVTNPANTRETARWVFLRGLPSRISGPSLNAKTGEIAIEELQIAHEGLRLTGPGGR
jgi:phage tail-like protein